MDLVAIRKDHKHEDRAFDRGDRLDIVLIQVKGGSAAAPTEGDVRRLREVARRHGARDVLLASWKKGRVPGLQRLRGGRWVRTTVREAFG